ncbi:hypothetical protein DdX_17015 [Ditylenchus destructor]|uniref:Uncharacterized protein n=1 Tax=Ditylenchus destructor TaxID=166010 RepID=A0AAD4MSK2_9BILA|nr:hypothetical protein DdX_17015 [Ditylenchus destructor]
MQQFFATTVKGTKVPSCEYGTYYDPLPLTSNPEIADTQWKCRVTTCRALLNTKGGWLLADDGREYRLGLYHRRHTNTTCKNNAKKVG